MAATSFDSSGIMDLIRSGKIRRNDDDEDVFEPSPVNMDRNTREEPSNLPTAPDVPPLPVYTPPGGRGSAETQLGTGQSPIAVGPADSTANADSLPLAARTPGMMSDAVRQSLSGSPLSMTPVTQQQTDALPMRSGPDYATGNLVGRYPGARAYDAAMYDREAGRTPQSPIGFDTSNLYVPNPTRTPQGTNLPIEQGYREGKDQAGNTISRGRGVWASILNGMARGGPMFGLFNGVGALLDPMHGREEVFHQDTNRFDAEKREELTLLNADPVEKAKRDFNERTGILAQQQQNAERMAEIGKQNKLELQDAKAADTMSLQDLRNSAAYTRTKMVVDGRKDVRQMIINAAKTMGVEQAAAMIAAQSGSFDQNGQPLVTRVHRQMAADLMDEERESKVDKTEAQTANIGKPKGVTPNWEATEEMRPFNQKIAGINTQITKNRNNQGIAEDERTANETKLKGDLKAAIDEHDKKLEEIKGRGTPPPADTTPTNTPGRRTRGHAVTPPRGNDPQLTPAQESDYRSYLGKYPGMTREQYLAVKKNLEQPQ